jgi:ABC-2 type transport system permease protein
MLKYDFKRFLRDWLMVVFSVVTLIMYVVAAKFVPDDIAPKWKIAVTKDSAAVLAPIMATHMKDANLAMAEFADETALKAAFVEGGDYFIGISFDAGAQEMAASGERPKARIYVDETTPPEAQTTARAIGAMIASAALLPSNGGAKEVERLGPVIEKVNFHDRTQAMMAVFLLMVEMLALASLIAREVTSGVVHAILTTIVSLPCYFAA